MRRRLPWGFFAAIVLTGCSDAPTKIAKAPTNTEVSEQVLAAVLAGEPAKIWPVTLDREKKGMELSEPLFRTLFDEVVRPEFGGLKPDGGIETDLNSMDLTATSFQRLRAPKGQPVDFGVSAYMTDAGPQVSFTNLLMQAWIARAAKKKGRPVLGSDMVRAVLEGFMEDRTRMSAAGLKHILRPAPDTVPLTFDKFEAHLPKRLADAGK